MQCPHCLIDFHVHERTYGIGHDVEAGYEVYVTTCSACQRYVIFIGRGGIVSDEQGRYLGAADIKMVMVYPRGMNRTACPPEVPNNIAEDYTEACIVLNDSPKASAALSRRCLQHILRETGKVKHANLDKEIEEVIGRGDMPSQITELLHAVRNVGNFAAHPMKDKATGEILPVEPGEAELNLEVVEALFDFYYVAPAKNQKRKDDLNKKLIAAGKPPIK